MKQDETITKAEAIHLITTEMEGPMNLDEIVNQVLEIWPSSAKNPKIRVRQTIRDEHLGKDLLFLDENTLIPMHLAMPGIRFRVPLTRREINRGWLFVDPAFQYMAKGDVSAEDYHLEDDKGKSIPVNPLSEITKVNTIFGVHEHEQIVLDLRGWYKKNNLRRSDSLLITILDWKYGHFRLQPETARTRKRYEAEIQQQNKALANNLFQALETAHNEYILGHVAIPTAYFRLKDPSAYPADLWIEILEKDPRMRLIVNVIRYADWTSPIEDMFSDTFTSPTRLVSPPPKHLSKEQAAQVYRFKAYLWHRKGLWRRIEIQGGQNLADFDKILRDAFKHDHWDHLSGFWKLVRRGQGCRYREIDIGNINPFEEDRAAEIQVASLELKLGDALKYVYDFGDWIEHRVELEAIVATEKDVKYPRIVGQNKPHYHYCPKCKEAGKKVIATWICLTCSNNLQEDVFICETCADRDHEDHYIEAILY